MHLFLACPLAEGIVTLLLRTILKPNEIIKHDLRGCADFFSKTSITTGAFLSLKLTFFGLPK